MKRFGALLLCGLMAVAAASARAADLWGDIATISPTSPLQANRLCYTDGLDIACDDTAPYLTSGGLLGIGISPTVEVEVSGTISATSFMAGNIAGLAAPISQSLQSSGTAAGGNATEVQYNNGGVLAGSSAFTWNNGTSTLTATNIAGLLTTAAQPNITSVGTLGSLDVTGVVSAGTVSGTFMYGQAASFTTLTVGGMDVTGGGTDRIVSGSVSAIAQAATDAVQVSGSVNVSGAVTAGGMMVAGDGSCVSNFGSVRINPATGRLQMCLERP